MCLFVLFLISFSTTCAFPDVKPTGYLTANAQNSSAGEGTYHFYEGEPTTFTCHRTAGGFVELSYTTRAGDRHSTDVQAKASVQMYVRLSAASNNDTIVNCIVTDEFKERNIVYALHLVRKNRKDILGFQVNGLTLPRLGPSGSRVNEFEYKYCKGESLSVKILKEEPQGDVSCNVTGLNLPSSLKKYFDNKNKLLMNPINMVFDEKQKSSVILDCALRSDQSQRFLSITLDRQTPDYEPFMTRLSMANIQLKYTNTKTNVIHYDYFGNEELYVYTKRKSIINYSDLVLTYNERGYVPSVRLLQNMTRAVIVIKSQFITNKITKVTIIRSEKQREGPTLEGVEVTPGNTWSHVAAGDNTAVIGASCAATILLSSIVLWIVVHLVRRRRGIPHTDSIDTTHQDLTEKCQRSSLCDSLPRNGVEHLYSKPIPKSQRPRPAGAPAPVEPTYDSVHENCDELYAVCGQSTPYRNHDPKLKTKIIYRESEVTDAFVQGNCDEMYEECGGSNDLVLRSDQLVYAEVDLAPPTGGRKCTPRDVYVQVKFKDSEQNCDNGSELHHGYVNVFPNAKYVNIGNNEYTETAYCEVNITRNIRN